MRNIIGSHMPAGHIASQAGYHRINQIDTQLDSQPQPHYKINQTHYKLFI